jgi:PII-like signaling protein
MQGYALRFYMHENQKHHGQLLYDWLLGQAKRLGIDGGSAFKSMAGYGRHGVLHERHFFELEGSMTVLVEFIVDAAGATRLLEVDTAEGAPLFWARFPAEFGVIGPEPA